jgi:hypothetical protein
MKIRSGFVSNSSSSSFILTYQKSKVINDPEEMVKFVQEHPNSHSIFRGRGLSDGEDYFELDWEMEALIRKFPKQFIESCNKYAGAENYRLYTNADISRDPTYDCNISVDMSDLGFTDLTESEMSEYLASYNGKELRPEIKEKVSKRDEYYRIQEERREAKEKEELAKAEEEAKEWYLKHGVPADDLEAEQIWIDYSSLYTEGDASDFAAEYVANDMETAYNNFISNDTEPKAYVLFYDELIEDRAEIMKVLEERCETSDNYLFFNNPILNSVDDDEGGVSVDYFNIGPKELEVLKESFDNNSSKVYLATNATVVAQDGGSVPKSTKFIVGYGRVAVIGKGEDLTDFKELFDRY